MLEDEYFPGFPSQKTGVKMPVPDTNTRLTTRPHMECRVMHLTGVCGEVTDLLLQVSNIKGAFTDDIPVCPAHAWSALQASRLLFHTGRIVQWKAVETVEYQAHTIPEGELNK